MTLEMQARLTGVSVIVSAVYHYQLKVHMFSYKNSGDIQPTLYIKLYGSNADSQNLPLEM